MIQEITNLEVPVKLAPSLRSHRFGDKSSLQGEVREGPLLAPPASFLGELEDQPRVEVVKIVKGLLERVRGHLPHDLQVVDLNPAKKEEGKIITLEYEEGRQERGGAEWNSQSHLWDRRPS